MLAVQGQCSGELAPALVSAGLCGRELRLAFARAPLTVFSFLCFLYCARGTALPVCVGVEEPASNGKSNRVSVVLVFSH